MEEERSMEILLILIFPENYSTNSFWQLGRMNTWNLCVLISLPACHEPVEWWLSVVLRLRDGRRLRVSSKAGGENSSGDQLPRKY